MIHNPISLSIIVPAFNEGELLNTIVKTTLQEAKVMLKNRFEIIIVDDGSTDGTRRIAQKVAGTDKKITLIRHTTRQGFGATMISAIQIARCEYITFIPADGQVFLRDLIEPLAKVSDCDVLVGYRLTKKDYTVFRHILSHCFKLAMNFFFGFSLRDYNWVHIYNKNIFTRIKPESKGVFFLGEVLVKAKNLNFRIRESRVKYRSRISGMSKNGNIWIAGQTVKDLFKVWFTEGNHI